MVADREYEIGGPKMALLIGSRVVRRLLPVDIREVNLAGVLMTPPDAVWPGVEAALSAPDSQAHARGIGR